MAYHWTLRLLHWGMVALLAWQVYSGWRLEGMEGPRAHIFAAYAQHKTVGMIALLLAIIRLSLRLIFGGLPQEQSLRGRLADFVHWMLYGVMLLYPLSGWALHSSARFGSPNAILAGKCQTCP